MIYIDAYDTFCMVLYRFSAWPEKRWMNLVSYDYLARHGFEVGRLFPRRVHVQPYSFAQESIRGGIFVAFRKEDGQLRELLT